MIDAETVNRRGASEAEIRRALAECLHSQTFRRSPKLAAFLTFIVEEELAGRGEAIKAYTIATRALNRATSFDPANDPSVRVEAGRLRRALEEAQAEDGGERPLRIHVPVGGYRPVFEVRERAAGAPEGPPLPVIPIPAPPLPPAHLPVAAPLFDSRGQAIIAGLLAAIVVLLAVDVAFHGYMAVTVRGAAPDPERAGFTRTVPDARDAARAALDEVQTR
ncbi:tetratricopeptide TPR_2 repeat protein [Methylobacterium sp. 4-46]|uniref:hypothetical protein n=1 Tax=unclassified Methylobacterium TaxID=2615210 RepID=UPI000152CBD1|nr:MULTISPECIES: hypothetical protein [Methylobacterium]ACA19563.1 tetratricopeptide TPR_2 repeat protein [Methylobacterium sp. 4-46]WFT78758.1 hypothetical protein QA634_26355 [Methylobacterium nodulans]